MLRGARGRAAAGLKIALLCACVRELAAFGSRAALPTRRPSGGLAASRGTPLPRVRRPGLGVGVRALHSVLRSFSEDDIDFCRTGDGGGLKDENDNLDLSAMATRLCYSGRLVEWVGEEPRTAGGRAWKKVCDATQLPLASGVRSSEEVAVAVGDDALFSSLFKGPFVTGKPRATASDEAKLVVDAYSSFLGTPPPQSSLADLQLAEMPLFTINRILLPGGDFTVSIGKGDLCGKEMIDRVAVTKARRFGVVTTPDFATRPSETLTEKTISDFTPASASASGGGPSGMEKPMLDTSSAFHRDAQGRELSKPATRVFSRVGTIAEMFDGPMRLDDGRYIVESEGRVPFRIVDIVQEEPYLVAIVQLLQDPPLGEADAEVRQAEIESWQAINDVCWLACELFDKRSWLPLLTNLDGRQHPLAKIKPFAPEQRQAGVRPALTRAAAAAAWDQRQRFAWHLIRVLRQGVPGLWDAEFTGIKLEDNAVLRMLQDLNLQDRIGLANKELKKAREHLRQHQRLRDIAERRDVPPPGFH